MAKRKKDNLESLEKLLGVKLDGNVDITIDKGSTVKELRIRSLGNAAYDIWSAEFEVKEAPVKNLKAFEESLGVKDLGEEVSLNVGEKNLRIKSMGTEKYDIWTSI